MALTAPRCERKPTPILRPSVLQKLEADLYNELVYRRFVETYVQR
jgi:hypothetical protein